MDELTDEATFRLLEGIMDSYRYDMCKAMSEVPVIRDRELMRLKVEAEKGILSMILGIVGLNYEDILYSVRKELHREN